MNISNRPAELSGGVVAKLNRNRRLALRFCVYIKALGVVPLPYQGQALEAYAIVLQRQYENLRHEFGPEASRAALIAGRAAVKQRGFAQIATEFPLLVPPTRKKHRLVSQEAAESQSTELPTPTASRRGSERLRKSESNNCRRKFRHTDFLSALLHARRLADDDLHIYSCDLCDGLHVGHDPTPPARRRRRITKQLRALQTKIEEADRERTQLLRQQLQLRSELIAVLQERRAERSRKVSEDGAIEIDDQMTS